MCNSNSETTGAPRALPGELTPPCPPARSSEGPTVRVNVAAQQREKPGEALKTPQNILPLHWFVLI